mgnify:CR=1 FL=1
MKAQKISESGLIGTDGRLRIPMERVNAWCAEHKGERVVIRFDAAAPGSSELQLAYYYNYIVPTIQTALYELGERMNEKKVDEWLRQQCPSIFETFIPPTKEQAEQGYLGCTETKEIRDLSVSEMSDYLDWLKQFAAENLYVYIEDPRTL